METTSQKRRYNAAYKPLTITPSVDKIEKEGKKWTILWRIICFVMIIFFLLAAYVQLNDPDPYIWVPGYLIPAALTTAIIIKPDITGNVIWRTVCLVNILVCVAGIIYLLVVVIEILMGKIVNPLEHEEGRELGGVVIILCWLSLCRFTRIGSPDPTKGSANALLLVTLVLGCLPVVVWGLCFIESFQHQLGHCKDMF